jgi:hypothetical protein
LVFGLKGFEKIIAGVATIGGFLVSKRVESNSSRSGMKNKSGLNLKWCEKQWFLLQSSHADGYLDDNLPFSCTLGCQSLTFHLTEAHK